MSDTRKTVPLLILGGGLAGLGAGIEAKRRGIDSIILESDSQVGGLCKNTTVHECDFDLGPKILILDESENSKDILSFLGGDYEKYPMRESVYLDEYGQLGFPLQRHLIDLPEDERERIILEIREAQSSNIPIESYRDWLKANYGSHLSETILIPYEEKKWQTSLDELDYEWALSRPVRVKIDEIERGARERLPADKSYFYPKQGNISVLSQSMAKSAGSILLNHPVTEIDVENKCVTAGGRKFYYDKLISTIPLDSALAMTKGASLKDSRSDIMKRLGIRVFNLVFDGNFDLAGTAIYFPEKKYMFRRVSILQNLCPALARDGLTPISVEVSLGGGNTMSQQAMLDEVLLQLQDIPQFAQLGAPIASQTLEIGFAYPLQSKGLRSLVQDIHEEYSKYGVYHCGRGGNFDYCNSDIAYLQGKQAVATINQS